MEIYKDLSNPETQEFEKLLNSQLSKIQIEEGKIIDGKINKITDKFVFLFVEGLKSDPVLDINELKSMGLSEKIKVGEKLPSAQLFKVGEKGIDELDSLEYVSNKKVVLVAVPGAFTPTCSFKQMPGFVDHADEILSKNVDEIICVAVTNPFVMKAWGKSLSVGEKITMLADGNGAFAKACDLELDLSVMGIGKVSSRYAIIIEDGTVTSFLDEGGGGFELSSAENILEKL